MTVRIAVDIGGTFTDATLIDEESGPRLDREDADDAVRPLGGLHDGRRARARGGRRSPPATSASSCTRRPSRRTRSSRARSRAAASSPPRASATCSRSRARSARRSTTRSSRSRRRSCRATARSRCASGSGPKGEVVTAARRRARCATPPRVLAREGVESVAVCLLHSYVNPEHERRVGAILAEELPGVPVSLSSEVAPEFREYLRASTTVINAVIRPVVERYLERIERRLADAGIEARLLVMQSSGGVFSSEAAARRPVFMVESGPGRGRDRRGAPRRARSTGPTSSRSTWAARPRRSA